MHILENGSSITDPTIIANKFNSYFLPQLPMTFNPRSILRILILLNISKNLIFTIFFISPTSQFEVFNIISNLKSGKASGPNSIPTVILKQFNNEISYVLSKLFNLSFSTGVFPDVLKISSVLPLFKKTLNYYVVTTGLYLYFQTSARYLKNYVLTFIWIFEYLQLS